MSPRVAVELTSPSNKLIFSTRQHYAQRAICYRPSARPSHGSIIENGWC